MSIALADPKAEEVRRSHHDALLELQSSPAARAKVIASVTLADGKKTTVAHGLGRAPRWVGVSVPRGAVSAGFVTEVRGGVDATKSLVLTASGYGATVTVDVMVV